MGEALEYIVSGVAIVGAIIAIGAIGSMVVGSYLRDKYKNILRDPKQTLPERFNNSGSDEY